MSKALGPDEHSNAFDKTFNRILFIITNFFSSLRHANISFPLLFFQCQKIFSHVGQLLTCEVKVGEGGPDSPYITVGQNFTDKDKCSAEDFISHPDGHLRN